MQDWIHKYPGVAAMLEQEGDVIVQDIRSSAQGLQPYTDFMLWAGMVFRKMADARQHTAASCYAFVAPDIYAKLQALVDPREDGQGALSFGGLVAILPEARCPEGTWFFHRSDHPRFPHVVRVCCVSWKHFVMRQWVDAPPGPGWAFCTTQRPALICACGAYVLEWQ
jgi:hypothetical protein